MRQELAALIQKWADNPGSYFEFYCVERWAKQSVFPNIEADLSRWRLVMPPKEIELEDGDFYFITRCEVFEGHYNAAKYGTVRKTEELAKAAAKRTLQSNRLSALIDQIAGEPYEFIPGICNTIIYNDSGKGKWRTETNSYSYSPERIYGTPETMKKVCQILNDGLFNL